MTGPYDRFRIMLYDVHYRILLNHFSHKINLITKTDNKFVYGVKVLSEKSRSNNSITKKMPAIGALKTEANPAAAPQPRRVPVC